MEQQCNSSHMEIHNKTLGKSKQRSPWRPKRQQLTQSQLNKTSKNTTSSKNIDPSDRFALAIPINQFLQCNNSQMEKWIQ